MARLRSKSTRRRRFSACRRISVWTPISSDTSPRCWAQSPYWSLDRSGADANCATDDMPYCRSRMMRFDLSTGYSRAIAQIAVVTGNDAINFLERFRAKACPGLDPGWIPVRVKKTHQNKRLEPGSDSIRTDKALAPHDRSGAAEQPCQLLETA